MPTAARALGALGAINRQPPCLAGQPVAEGQRQIVEPAAGGGLGDESGHILPDDGSSLVAAMITAACEAPPMAATVTRPLLRGGSRPAGATPGTCGPSRLTRPMRSSAARHQHRRPHDSRGQRAAQRKRPSASGPRVGAAGYGDPLNNILEERGDGVTAPRWRPAVRRGRTQRRRRTQRPQVGAGDSQRVPGTAPSSAPRTATDLQRVSQGPAGGAVICECPVVAQLG